MKKQTPKIDITNKNVGRWIKDTITYLVSMREASFFPQVFETIYEDMENDFLTYIQTLMADKPIVDHTKTLTVNFANEFITIKWFKNGLMRFEYPSNFGPIADDFITKEFSVDDTAADETERQSAIRKEQFALNFQILKTSLNRYTNSCAPKDDSIMSYYMDYLYGHECKIPPHAKIKTVLKSLQNLQQKIKNVSEHYARFDEFKTALKKSIYQPEKAKTCIENVLSAVKKESWQNLEYHLKYHLNNHFDLCKDMMSYDNINSVLYKFPELIKRKTIVRYGYDNTEMITPLHELVKSYNQVALKYITALLTYAYIDSMDYPFYNKETIYYPISECENLTNLMANCPDDRYFNINHGSWNGIKSYGMEMDDPADEHIKATICLILPVSNTLKIIKNELETKTMSKGRLRQIMKECISMSAPVMSVEDAFKDSFFQKSDALTVFKSIHQHKNCDITTDTDEINRYSEYEYQNVMRDLIIKLVIKMNETGNFDEDLYTKYINDYIEPCTALCDSKLLLPGNKRYENSIAAMTTNIEHFIENLALIKNTILTHTDAEFKEFCQKQDLI